MKRRSFLLTIPLIGMAVKAMSEPKLVVRYEFNPKALEDRLKEIRKYHPMNAKNKKA